MMKMPLKYSITFILNWLIKLFMKKKSLGKLLALAIGFSTLACHDPSELGFGLGTDSHLNAIFTDTVSIKYSTVLADSAVNGNANYILSGKIVDPAFGDVEAVAYFQPSLLPQFNSAGNIITATDGSYLYDTLSLKSTPSIDSLKFRIYCDGNRVYGDTNAISTFRIHRLKEVMKSGNYNADEKQAYDPTPLAEFSLNLPQLRNDSTQALMAKFVSLPLDLAKEMVQAAADAKGDNKAFVEKFKGFAIVPDKNNKAVYGFSTGVLNLSGLNSSVVPYYHFTGDTTSSFYIFNINGPRYTSFDFDRSKTALAGLSKSKNELPLSGSVERLYLQAGSGITPKIDLSALQHLGKNMKVAKATLEFQLDPAATNGLYKKSYFMTLAEADSKNQQKRNSAQQLVYLYNGQSDVIMGDQYTLLDTTNYFNVDITNYLQRQIFKGDLNKQILLLPGIPTTTAGTAMLANDNLARLVFLKPRLLLYYNKY
jgi:hypothetical protein